MATAKDPVGAARKAIEAAEAAEIAEGRRLAGAIEKADRFAEEAAGIDPDGDAKGFERATSKLAELRATVEIVRAREASAKGKAEAAREALAAAEAADKRARITEIDAQIAEREPKAIQAARVALAAFDAAAVELAKLAAEANKLGLGLAPEPHKARGVRGIAPYAGNPLGALVALRDGRML